MKHFASIILGMVLMIGQAHAQTADGQFTTNFDGSTLEVTLDLQGNPVAKLAQTTLRFTFNSAGLAYAGSPVDGTDYAFQNYSGFIGSSLYNSFVTNNSGEVSVNIDLAGGTGEDLPSSWTPVVTLYFDIIDHFETSNLQWTLTQVYEAPGGVNDAYTIGTFADLDIPLDESLPIELASFDAVVQGSDVVLNWSTGSGNAPGQFDVMMRTASGPWERAGEAGSSTSDPDAFSYRIEGLSAGTYSFRLGRIGEGGGYSYSSAVEARVTVLSGLQLFDVYPNPVVNSGTVGLSSSRSQAVTVELYNVIGQRVQTLFEGDMTADATRTFRFDSGQLPAGTYFLRAKGVNESVTRRVVVAR
ncbi:MAG: T9SS type A sorting domain-containing protein [Rhodothermales bacterium]